jgi:hypothetical protein
MSWLCLRSGGSFPTSHLGSPGLIISKFMWDLWRTKWHKAGSTEYFGFLYQFSFCNMPISLICCPRLLQWVIYDLSTEASSLIVLEIKSLHEAQIHLNLLYRMTNCTEINIWNIHTCISVKWPVTVTDRSKACTVFAPSEAGIVGSNPTQGMDV